MRDTVAGERLIKTRKSRYVRYLQDNNQAPQNLRYYDWQGTAYLPQLHQQTPEAYSVYRDRAVWLDATSRTLEFYLSLIFRKQVMLKDGDDPVQLPRNPGGNGETLHELCMDICRDWFTTGRVGIMPDTSDDGENRTVAERERLGLGPYIAWYSAEQIINWRYTTKAGRMTLSLVVLRELDDVPVGSEFDHSEEETYRVLRLRDEGATVQEYDANGDEKTRESPILANGEQLAEIPFRILDASGDGQPPLEGIATINLAHYRNSASFENGLHHAGIPTPTLAGWDGESDKLFLGTDRALVSSNPAFKAAYLEFHGHGLNQVKQALDDKRRDMANLGARLLMDESRFNEAAETVLMRKAGEQSIIAKLAQHFDLAMTWAVQMLMRFEGAPTDYRVRLNRDLLPASMSHQMVVALMNLQISGNLSKKVLFERLKDGEIVDSETDFESMLKDIEADQAKEEERMLRVGEQDQMIGRHADRMLPDSDPGDAHRRGMSAARGNE
jgi:hypothetical protein